MREAFSGIQEYSSEVEQIYYRKGIEDERFRFHYAFRKPDRVRVDFVAPHAGLKLFYRRGDAKATLCPFPSVPSFRPSLSIDNPLLKTPTGQCIHQTDMVFFIDFLFKNLRDVPQKASDLREEEGQVSFTLWATDYVKKGEAPDKFRIAVCTRTWLPLRVERYSSGNSPLEVSMMRNYRFNVHPDDRWFDP